MIRINIAIQIIILLKISFFGLILKIRTKTKINGKIIAFNLVSNANPMKITPIIIPFKLNFKTKYRLKIPIKMKRGSVSVKFELFMARERIVGINFYLFGCPYTMALSGVILAQSLDSKLYTMGREYYRQLLEPLELPRALAGKVIIVEDSFYAAIDELRRDIK